MFELCIALCKSLLDLHLYRNITFRDDLCSVSGEINRDEITACDSDPIGLLPAEEP